MTKPTDMPPSLEGIDPPAGVWRAFGELRNYRLRDALWPEVTLALIFGVSAAALAIRATTPAERVAAMGDVLPLAGVLLAVTFAALAFVVSIPSGNYLRMLARTAGGGMRRFLDPYLVAVGAQIVLILVALGYRLFAAGVAPWIEHVVFGAAAVLLVYNLLDVASLARQLVQHGVLRAADAALAAEEADEEAAKVHRLHEKGGGSR